MKVDERIWTPLLDAVDRFKDAAPWTWLTENEIIGVRDPETGVAGYCCITGNLGEQPGLAIFQGPEGLANHQAVFIEETVDPLDSSYLQEGLTVLFLDKDELRKEEYQLVKGLGRKYRGRQQWPSISNHRPGFVPQVATEEDARFLTVVLEELLEVALEAREQKGRIAQDEDGRFVLREKLDGQWTDSRSEDPVEPTRPSIPEFDPDPWQKLTDSPLASQTLWMGDHFFLPGSVEEGPRPFFGRALAWLAQARPVPEILDIHVSTPDSGVAELRERFFQAVQEVGRPEVVVVRRSEVYQGMLPVQRVLGFELIWEPAIEKVFRLFRDFLSQALLEDS